jgi:hypothetical protein
MPNQIVAAEEVEGSRPVACWSVQEGDWRDELPAEVAALLAPPVIVSAEAFVPTGRSSPVRDNGRPAGYDPRHAPAGYDPRHAAPDDATTRFITPGRPRRRCLRNRRTAHAA